MAGIAGASSNHMDTRWRGLDCPDVVAQRILRLDSPHMKPLNDYVERLRLNFGVVPYFDPFDGGIDARLLVFLETPGPSSARVRFTSRDNPTGTARNLRKLFASTAIERHQTAIWNAVPWVLSRKSSDLRAPSQSDLNIAAAFLPELVALFPNLSTIILAGKTAYRLEADLVRTTGGAEILRMPHPSPTYVNTSPLIFPAMLATFARGAERAQGGDRVIDAKLAPTNHRPRTTRRC